LPLRRFGCLQRLHAGLRAAVLAMLGLEPHPGWTAQATQQPFAHAGFLFGTAPSSTHPTALSSTRLQSEPLLLMAPNSGQ